MGAAIAAAPIGTNLQRVLDEARAACSLRALDEAVDAIEARARAAGGTAADWTLLAEAYLERAQQRTLLRGLTVGQPLFSELPPQFEFDIDAGAAAIAEARRLGADSATSFRVEASLLSQRITGLLSALRFRGDIRSALEAARERDPDDPKLLVALGLQQLLAPKMFGHDPRGALKQFERAHENGGDERSAVFAAMACWLLEQPSAARQWLETATAQNPSNLFARAVRARVLKGDQDPFQRDVSDQEVAAIRGN